MSLRTFTDNVIDLAVKSCLVRSIPTILTPKKVDRISDEELTALAAESEEVQSNRQVLQDQTRILREALERCQQHRPRKLTGRSKRLLAGPCWCILARSDVIVLPTHFASLSPSIAGRTSTTSSEYSPVGRDWR